MKDYYDVEFSLLKKFEYLQVEYNNYPTAEELNEKGVEGWEFIIIHQYKK